MKDELCPCGSSKKYPECCGRYLDGNEIPATAEILMRSRYTAYTLLREEYLLASWHASTRPAQFGLANETASKWLGLQIKRQQQQDNTHAIVEFIAIFKINGRAHRMHEISNFVREDGRWFYVDGEINEKQ